MEILVQMIIEFYRDPKHMAEYEQWLERRNKAQEAAVKQKGA